MIVFVLRRLAVFIPVLFVIVTGTFFFIRMAPGGPFDAGERAMSPQVLEALQEHFNMNAPLYVQYFDFLGDLARGDLGPTLSRPGYTVNEIIAWSFPVSLELGFYALLIALLIGMTAGVVAALKPNSMLDYAPMSLAMFGICIPNFVLGPVLVLVFALWVDWLPVAGWDRPSEKVLPAITLGATYAAYIARLSRGGMLEVLSQDFIRTARAKGLSETRVVLRHALRGGLRPVTSYLGPAAAAILTGSFVVEKIFDIPGLGSEFVNAALNRDYTMIMGTVLVYAVLILLFNLVVDVVQAWLDPRLRSG
jgi:oligopeptide transport system permease protein